jgi:hypothetical protein
VASSLRFFGFRFSEYRLSLGEVLMRLCLDIRPVMSSPCGIALVKRRNRDMSAVDAAPT